MSKDIPSNWTPPSDVLNHLVKLLQASCSGQATAPRNLQLELDKLSEAPEFACVLGFAFAKIPSLDLNTRAVAGLTLKNHIIRFGNDLHNEVIGYVKDCVLDALTDPDGMIRSTAGTIITNIVSTYSLNRWLSILEKLVQLTQTQDLRIVESSFKTIEKVCEDNAVQIIDNPSRPLEKLIPFFISSMGHPSSAVVRAESIKCVNHFLHHTDCQVVHDSVPLLLPALYQRAGDESTDVRCAVCFAMTRIFEFSPGYLMEQLDNVVDFMLYCLQGSSEAVKLEASEFWLSFAENPDLRQHLRPYLPRAVPVLLQCMVYTEDELLAFGTVDEDDAAVPDKENDIKPRHHKAKLHGSQHNGLSDKPNSSERGLADSADHESEDSYDEEDDEEFDSEWSVRKCSAAAIDVMSTVFNDDFLPVLLPPLQTMFASTQWQHREAAILALGAVAYGCVDGLTPHLPSLMTLLLQSLQDQKLLIRVISAWTLSRYASWCVNPPVEVGQLEAHRNQYFGPLMAGLLKTILDRNKRVQDAACSALGTVVEAAGPACAPYTIPCLQAFVEALGKYQHKNLLVLYDSIGTLAESVGSALSSPEHCQIIVPPLLEKWNQIGDDDTDIFPLLECLSALCISAGSSFLPFAEQMWKRALHVIGRTVEQQRAHEVDPSQVEQPDKDFIVASLDLLSAITQGLGFLVQALAAYNDPSLLQMMSSFAADENADVRQSSFALLGDLATSAFPVIKSGVSTLVELCIMQIDPEVPYRLVSVINNAIWATGVLILQDRSIGEKYGQQLLPKVCSILTSERGNKMLLENCSITLGSLGAACPLLVAPHMNGFIDAWCRSLQYVATNAEKQTAFLGICDVVLASPQCLSGQNLVRFIEALALYKEPSEPISTRVGKILTGYHTLYKDQWPEFVKQCSANVHNLLNHYKVPSF